MRCWRNWLRTRRRCSNTRSIILCLHGEVTTSGKLLSIVDTKEIEPTLILEDVFSESVN